MKERTTRALEEVLKTIPQLDYPCMSRIHPLKTYDIPNLNCYVKRDDELGFGISGSKFRKYRSLIPHILNNRFDEVAIIGGPTSNNVLGLSQLLIENRIPFHLFLREGYNKTDAGNGLWIKLLADAPIATGITLVPRNDWNHVDKFADIYRQNALQHNKRVLVLPEGASIAESLPGALSLPVDIARNEQEFGVAFDHIFMESGTGLSVSALILGYAWMLRKTQIHVILLAGDKSSFRSQLERFHQAFQNLMGDQLPLPENFKLHFPVNAASFGSVNAQVFDTIRTLAQSEGFLTDPIYSAKLFSEAKHILHTGTYAGNALLIHSGGAFTLATYQNKLQ